MNYKGINYDVGTSTTHGTLSRETFDPQIVRREIEIIQDDLHCNAIRISGQDVERLVLAGNFAIQQGLDVWLSPSLPDATEEETLQYFEECARAAEDLRKQSPTTVLITGVELTAFMRGLLEGDTPMQRLSTLTNPLRLIKSTITKGSFHKNLNTFLSKAMTAVRQHFHGRITYASGPWEEVDWSPFDFVGVDYYRDAMNKKVYEKNLHKYFKHGKPVVITEFGSCTYKGAEDKGGYGWAVVDWSQTPPQLNQQLTCPGSRKSRSLNSPIITVPINAMTTNKINHFLEDVTNWASKQPDIQALALVGSYARDAAKETSDVDLVLIVADRSLYLQDTSWVQQFGSVKEQQIEDYSLLISVRVFYMDGLEVEYGITDERWSAVPLDEGTRRVTADGMRVLFERGNILSRHQCSMP